MKRGPKKGDLRHGSLPSNLVGLKIGEYFYFEGNENLVTTAKVHSPHLTEKEFRQHRLIAVDPENLKAVKIYRVTRIK